MENDSIRASGSNTLVDIWVDGKLRAICVTKAAIETFLGSSATGEMSDESRCEFVRTHLPELASAVKAKLKTTNSAADSVTLEAGQLGGVGDRRKGERRRSDRRKVKVPLESLPHGERRRGQRRGADRRRPDGSDR
ncbi:MAG TPA: hypothetical protein VGU01_09090 [Sphingomicrobium sp.]|nr:hypothetical protein [Sphingomicrobium sp.]